MLFGCGAAITVLFIHKNYDDDNNYGCMVLMAIGRSLTETGQNNMFCFSFYILLFLPFVFG